MKLLLAYTATFLAFASAAFAERTLTDYERLDDFLFNGPYNPKVFPAKTKGDTVTANFGLSAVRFEMEADGRLKALMWARLVYEDHRLAYKSEDFGGIDVIRVDPTRIWTPDMALYTSIKADMAFPTRVEAKSRTNALIYPNGKVLFVPPVEEKLMCEPADAVADMWGRYTCSLKYGSWTYDSDTMDLQFYDGKEEIDMDDYQRMNSFKVLSNTAERVVKYYDCCPEPYVSLTFNITLQRTHVMTAQGMAVNPRAV